MLTNAFHLDASKVDFLGSNFSTRDLVAIVDRRGADFLALPVPFGSNLAPLRKLSQSLARHGISLESPPPAQLCALRGNSSV